MTTVEQHTDVFRMPALGADMTDGSVIEWYVEQGARVERGDLVAVVETDKADIEIEVFDPCVFDEFLVDVGEQVAVGEPIARITLDEPPRAATPPIAEAPDEPVTTVGSPDRTDPPDVTAAPRRLTPRARRLAQDRGLDLTELPSDGTVTGESILRISANANEERPKRDRQASMRSAVARLMERSWTEIPHYHVTSPIDLTDASRRLEALNAPRDVDDRIVPAAMLYAAVARAARDTPQLTGWWQENSFTESESVDLGVILSLRTGGIVVPTIQSADELDTAQMMTVLRDLVERARRGRLRQSDMQPASISITNMGDRGADAVLGIIHPPQVALVGLGAPRLRPAVVDGAVVPRLLLQASVAGDHRAHDGLVAARLLTRLVHHLKELP